MVVWLDILHLTDVFDVVLVPKALPPPTQSRYYLNDPCQEPTEVRLNRWEGWGAMIAIKLCPVSQDNVLHGRPKFRKLWSRGLLFCGQMYTITL